MNKYFFLLKQNRILFIGAFILFFLLFFFIVSSFTRFAPLHNPDGSLQNNTPSLTPTIIQTQKSFRILKTNPALGENNIYPGEIIITITTNEPVVSVKNISLSFSPELPSSSYWKFTNFFPSKTLTAQIYGGLQLNTQYTVTIKNSLNQDIYDWFFITSGETPENNTQLVRESEEEANKKYFPLIKYVPYSTSTFSIDYVDGLILEVKMKGTNEGEIKRQVTDWIRNRGVDPSTHTIRYTR